MNIYTALAESDIFTWVVLAVLLGMSLTTWGIAAFKAVALRAVWGRDLDTLAHWRRTPGPPHPEAPVSYGSGPAALILQAAGVEYGTLRNTAPEATEAVCAGVENAITAVRQEAVAHLSRGLAPLATMAGMSPLLGLLGTVWGISQALLKIRGAGSTTVTVMAPGIFDALITTVAGLLVALPAVAFHNFFAHRLRVWDGELERLGRDVLARVRRELLRQHC